MRILSQKRDWMTKLTGINTYYRKITQYKLRLNTNITFEKI